MDVLAILPQLLRPSFLCTEAIYLMFSRKGLVTLRKSSVYEAQAHTSCLSLNLSFDVIGRENRLLDWASFHQIKRHHERQHGILALRHKDHLQDRRECLWITWIRYKGWSQSSSCSSIQKEGNLTPSVNMHCVISQLNTAGSQTDFMAHASLAWNMYVAK